MEKGKQTRTRGAISRHDLEQQLNLKQLQVNSLLAITKAINANVKAPDLFEMYRSFLEWEMGVGKMALFVSEGEHWACATSLGIGQELCHRRFGESLFHRFRQVESLYEEEDSPFREFEIVIPVHHKKQPLAFVFLADIKDDQDLHSKIQFITTVTNIVAVAIENKRLFKRQLEQERFRQELRLAAKMQRMLIPEQMPRTAFYEFDAIYQPKLGVGGDYYDILLLSEHKMAFCVGDISGKGVAAALLMANFQAHFHSHLNQRDGLEKLVRNLNESVMRITRGDKFITFFVAEYDMLTQQLRYVNAGHNPPLLISNGQLKKLDKGCTILGAFPKLEQVEIGEEQITHETLIMAYTDGLTDIRNEEGDFFDEDLGYKFVKTHYQLPVRDFNLLLKEELERFKGDTEYPDDLTVLTCKIY